MAVELRPVTALLVLAVVLGAGTMGSVVVTDAASGGDGPEPALVDAGSEDRYLWPMTSRDRSFEQRTLAINLVVYGDHEVTRQVLLEAGQGDWNVTEAEEQEVAPDEIGRTINGTSVAWDHADGAVRYVYLEREDAPGIWLTESYQVHDGDYLGSRHHVRAYVPPDPDEEWTAMQAHHEHWDWFSARHVVTSVEESQAHVESEFIDQPITDSIVREPVEIEDSSDFDGWLTIVDVEVPRGMALALLSGIALIGATTTRRERLTNTLADWYPEQEVRALVLAGAIVAVFVSVRFAAVGLERTVPIPPKLIGIGLYPVIFVGIPATAYVLARQLRRSVAFAAASLGFLTAILIDYTVLGVTALPLDALVHRCALAAALGFVAVAASRTERHDPDAVSHVQLGVLLWLVAMGLPLLRFTPLPV